MRIRDASVSTYVRAVVSHCEYEVVLVVDVISGIVVASVAVVVQRR